MFKKLLAGVSIAALSSSLAFAGTSTIIVPPGTSGTTYQIGTNGAGNAFGNIGLCDFAACAQGLSINPAGTAGANGAAIQGMPTGVPVPIAGSYFYNVASTVLTRTANTTAYSSTAGETVCQSTSTTCAPITLSLASRNGGGGQITRMTMVKSGSATTGANFIVYLFSAAPVLTGPTQVDATAYAGPRIADMPNYIGAANCALAQATSDTTAGVWYECTLSNPNSAGTINFQAVSGGTTLNALVVCTATSTNAYTPASAETFTVYASGNY